MEMSLEHKVQQALRHDSQSSQAYPSRTIVHAKLEMTEPGDHDEQEADAMASAIMSGGKISRKISSGASGSSGIAVSRQMESQLSQLQGGGRPMPQGLQNMMESGFGQSFGQVRIHTDAEAAGMNSSIHAKAFTLGNDIYFNRGQFSPETSEGQRLVAHELTHVVQGNGKVGRLPWGALGDKAVADGERQANEEILKKGYQELQSHGILFAISEEVFEFSSEYLKDPEGFKKSGRLSKNEIAWLEKIEKHLGKVKKGSLGFAILSKALTLTEACRLVYKAKHALSRDASGLQQAELLADAGFFFIGVAGGVPAAFFTTSYKFFIEHISDYAKNHPRETEAGILNFFGIPGSFDFYINPQNYLNGF